MMKSPAAEPRPEKRAVERSLPGVTLSKRTLAFGPGLSGGAKF